MSVCKYCGIPDNPPECPCACSIQSLRIEVNNLLAANKDNMDWFNDARARAEKAEAALSKEHAIVKGVHGALVDAGDIVVPGMDSDLYESVMEIVRQRNEARVALAGLWDRFVDEVRKQSKMLEVPVNFLGSIAWHKSCFDKVLTESAKQDARILEAARLFVAAKTCVPGNDWLMDNQACEKALIEAVRAREGK